MPQSMNSTTSPELQLNQEVYVPFWVLLEFIDAAPPDPFVKCRIINIGQRCLNSPTGQVQILMCDLEIKPGLVAPSLPVSHVIAKENLADWAIKIGDWFKEYKG